MEIRNVIIIGSGPSGYAAAIYTARAELKPLLFMGDKSGGQLMFTTEVENFPGFAEGVVGPKLMMGMQAQAEKFGTELVYEHVTKVDFSQRPFRVFANNTEYAAKAVIVTTGAESRMLGIPGELEYLGRGVSTCAVCDAAFYKGKNVFVAGGGDAAMEDALALTKFAKSVTMIHRRDSFRASKIMQQRVLEEHKDIVKVLWNTETLEISGDGKQVTAIKIRNVVDGKEQTLAADGFFLAIGHLPATGFLNGQVELDEKGYVVTRLGLGSRSVGLARQHVDENGLLLYPTMTSVEGVFAGGDNVDFRYRQAITAAGMGTMAALDAEWWLERTA